MSLQAQWASMFLYCFMDGAPPHPPSPPHTYIFLGTTIAPGIIYIIKKLAPWWYALVKVGFILVLYVIYGKMTDTEWSEAKCCISNSTTL